MLLIQTKYIIINLNTEKTIHINYTNYYILKYMYLINYDIMIFYLYYVLFAHHTHSYYDFI